MSARVVWSVGPERVLDLTQRGLIMGVLNVTPDSFSDGGHYFAPDDALSRGLQMLDQGADVLDIGGESTRPGSQPVPPDEQIRRIVPVISALSQARPDVLISVDTTVATVAEAALRAGARIVNDISAGRHDPPIIETVRAHQAGYIVMHMQGEPRTMQHAPRYDDVVAEVRDFLCERIRWAIEHGVPRERLVIDPGIGFGKTLAHNLALLQQLEKFTTASVPVLLGVSRKSFIGKVLGTDDLAAREWPTVALTSYGREKGARLFRVHDVRPNRQALTMTEAILNR
jgi:dihydropteroate synthase